MSALSRRRPEERVHFVVHVPLDERRVVRELRLLEAAGATRLPRIEESSSDEASPAAVGVAMLADRRAQRQALPARPHAACKRSRIEGVAAAGCVAAGSANRAMVIQLPTASGSATRTVSATSVPSGAQPLNQRQPIRLGFQCEDLQVDSEVHASSP